MQAVVTDVVDCRNHIYIPSILLVTVWVEKAAIEYDQSCWLCKDDVSIGILMNKRKNCK